MILSDSRKYYGRFLKGHEGKLHFAAHSHHFWPDVTREAQLKYWDDCALMSDAKWGKIFGEVIPKTQNHIAAILGLRDPKQIVFAPNTHELTARLLSLFVGRPSLSILTSSSEFHSWRRQLLRLTELPTVKVTTVPTDPILEDRRTFIDALKAQLALAPDLFFISQVFFDSGIALTDDELLELADAKSSATLMVVDGYHGFAAIPTSLAKLEGRIFYLGGGYKYAQAGEGVGFMVIPKGDWRPAYTGWFAEYAELTRAPGSQVGYSQDWLAFMGATQDMSGLYRFNAAWDLFKQENLTVNKIHLHAQGLQKLFLERLPSNFLKAHDLKPLYKPNLSWHGHFLTYAASSDSKAHALEEALKSSGILVDRRGPRVRFGFGLYQDRSNVIELSERLVKLSPAQ